MTRMADRRDLELDLGCGWGGLLNYIRERGAEVLPTGGRFYLQTRVFGRNMIPFQQISTRAPRNSDAWILALLGCQFPG